MTTMETIKASLLVLSIVLLTLVQPSTTRRLEKSARIIGGSDATIQQFPYQLSLRVSGRHWCGASAIGKRWALTAAHCLMSVSTPSDITLRGGSTIFSSGGVLIQVQQFYLHPNFDAKKGDFDVALVSTKTDISGENIKTITLPDVGTAIPTGAKATISGWGLTDTSSSLNPQNLQYVIVTIINQSDCNKSYAAFGGIDDVFFCAKENGRDSCRGDSGGPTVLNGKQIGVVSGGVGCAHPDFPGLYTRLSEAEIRNWIKKVASV